MYKSYVGDFEERAHRNHESGIPKRHDTVRMVLRAWGDVCIDSITHGFEKAGITHELLNTDLPIPEPEIPGSDKRPDDAPPEGAKMFIDELDQELEESEDNEQDLTIPIE